MDIPISLNTDSDGFVSQECPACSGRFKTKFGEGSSDPISFCPYCSHMGRDCWWTPEQAEYIADITKQHAAELVSREMSKIARDFNGKSGSGLFKVKMDVSSPRLRTPMPPDESELEMRIIEFACCGEHIKYSDVDGIQSLCCIICGKESPVSV